MEWILSRTQGVIHCTTHHLGGSGYRRGASPDLHVPRLGTFPSPTALPNRRTSLLALLDAGVATITTRGEDTPGSLAGAVRFADDPAEAFQIALGLSADRVGTDEMRLRWGRYYVDQFSWPRIVSLHRDLYETCFVGAAGRSAVCFTAPVGARSEDDARRLHPDAIAESGTMVAAEPPLGCHTDVSGN